jgi:hypothetical protein
MNSINIATYVLEAALDGITTEYLSRQAGEYDSKALLDSIPTLTLHELLEEYSDKGRHFVAFKTTEKGRTFLMNAKSMHRSAIAVSEERLQMRQK